MAKKNNEAKIKFVAETGDFNAAIKKADKELSGLRAELKRNSAEMENTGDMVGGLEQKHSLLESQLKATQTKTQALSNKLEAAVRIYGENSDEVTNLKRQLAYAQAEEFKLQTAINKCNDELQEQVQIASRSETATDQLTDKITEQEKELEKLKEQYANAVLEFGKTSTEANSLKGKISSLSGDLKSNKTALNNAKDAADKLDQSLDDAGSAASGASDGFTVMGGAIANLVSSAIQWGIDKLGEFVGWLKELPSATLESRQDMATLETSFKQAGFTTEQATNTWRELYQVFGEDDRAVEAANLIAKMSDNQQDLNTWVEITNGVWGTYQDSLPVESLAEASMETAKTGTVTGALADALNWSSEAATMFSKYMGEDVVTAEDAFNVALSECTTEQERQQLITETLTALYGDAAVKYNEAAEGQKAEKAATADSILAQNELATAIAPVTTAWENMKTQLITAVTPAISNVCESLSSALNWLKEHPDVLNAVCAALGTFATVLGVVAAAWGVYTVAQWAANSALLVPAVIIIAVIAAIALLVGAVVWIAQNWDMIKEKTIEVWNAIKTKVTTAANNVKNKVNAVWTNIKTKTTQAWDNVKQKVSDVWDNIKTGVALKVDSVRMKVTSVFNTLKAKVTNIWNSIKSAIQTPIEKARDLVSDAIDKIKGFFDFEFKWPSIPLPHFSITPKGWSVGDLFEGVVPSLGIEWYAKGGIMTKPTVFGMNGNNAMVGGEAGPEAILPISKLEEYISNAVENKMSVVNLQSLADAIEDLANRPIRFGINGREIALATASDGDNVNGLRSSFRTRGLVLD